MLRCQACLRELGNSESIAECDPCWGRTRRYMHGEITRDEYRVELMESLRDHVRELLRGEEE